VLASPNNFSRRYSTSSAGRGSPSCAIRRAGIGSTCRASRARCAPVSSSRGWGRGSKPCLYCREPSTRPARLIPDVWTIRAGVSFGAPAFIMLAPTRLRPFALPRPDALSPLPRCPLRRAHNTRRYSHPLAGDPGPVGVGRTGSDFLFGNSFVYFVYLVSYCKHRGAERRRHGRCC
jgi:hypothetical protein